MIEISGIFKERTTTRLRDRVKQSHSRLGLMEVDGGVRLQSEYDQIPKTNKEVRVQRERTTEI